MYSSVDPKTWGTAEKNIIRIIIARFTRQKRKTGGWCMTWASSRKLEFWTIMIDRWAILPCVSSITTYLVWHYIRSNKVNYLYYINKTIPVPVVLIKHWKLIVINYKLLYCIKVPSSASQSTTTQPPTGEKRIAPLLLYYYPRAQQKKRPLRSELWVHVWMG